MLDIAQLHNQMTDEEQEELLEIMEAESLLLNRKIKLLQGISTRPSVRRYCLHPSYESTNSQERG